MAFHARIGVALLLVAGASAAAPPLLHANPAAAATLVAAAEAGDRAAVEALLLGDPAVVHQADSDGTTSLHHAVNRNDSAMVDLLLKAGANPATRNRYGFPPLFLAAVNGNASIIWRLLAAGADPHTTVPGGETMLMTAARTGNRDAVRVLFMAGVLPNESNDAGQTALMWAAAANSADAIESLVANGANIHARTPAGLDALMFAVRGGQAEAAEALIRAGADVNGTLASGESVLDVALINTEWDLADMLIDNGIDPNAGVAGYTALHRIAVQRPIVRGVVFSAGMPVPIGTLEIMLDLARKLIARGLDVNARMTKDALKEQRFINNRDVMVRVGATAFLLAAKEADIELMELLLQAGADPTIPTFDGTTPMMAAAGLYSQRGSLKRFRDLGRADDLLTAVKMCHDLGNDVNAANDVGDTALHGAAYRGFAKVASFLIRKGAKLDAVDRRGLSPLAVASGVYYISGVQRSPWTADVLRNAMQQRDMLTFVPPPDPSLCLYCYLTQRDKLQAARQYISRLEDLFQQQLAASTE